MTAAVGFPTVRLIRIRIGDITLKELTPGKVTPINELSFNDNE
jgi:23S rRNA pseudouridine2457 synthase